MGAGCRAEAPRSTRCMATLKPSELALSRAVLSKIPPRPAGYGRTRELFPRNTGGAFDPISPAVVAADMTVGFLLTNDRAARHRRAEGRRSVASGPRRRDRHARHRDVRRAAVNSPYEAEIKRVDSGGRRQPPDRSGRHGADVAGARDRARRSSRRFRHAPRGRRSPAPTPRACSSRERHQAFLRAPGRARAPHRRLPARRRARRSATRG